MYVLVEHLNGHAITLQLYNDNPPFYSSLIVIVIYLFIFYHPPYILLNKILNLCLEEER